MKEAIKNDLKFRLELTLSEINETLRFKYKYEKNIGVLEGLSGIALFQFYYAKYTDNDAYADWGQESLFHIINSINKGYDFPTYSSGLAGVGWTFDHLTQNGFIDMDTDELLSSIDHYLFEVMKKNTAEHNYDFLHGAMGYIYYFLGRFESTINDKLKQRYRLNIKYFLDKLTETVEKDANGFKWLSDIRSKHKTIKGYNLSLSHGMSSIVSILYALTRLNLFKEQCSVLIYKTTSYLLNCSMAKSDHSFSIFPSWVLPNGQADKNSRLAWCYGDFGIGLACLKASQLLSNDILYTKALNILEHTTGRREEKNTCVVDASLCHGAFGNAQIYTSIYHATKDQLYRDAASYWINYGMDLKTHNDGYAGFKQWYSQLNVWKPKTTLLEGVAGIGLSIIDYLSDEQNTWDRCLLIS